MGVYIEPTNEENLNLELMKSVRKGDVLKAKQNLQEGALPDQHPDGSYPLIEAAFHGRHQVIKMLIDEFGVDTSVECAYKGPAVIAAVLSATGGPETIRVLAEAGANIDSTDENGYTPLMLAISLNKEDVAEEILRHKPNVLLGNFLGESLTKDFDLGKFETQIRALEEEQAKSQLPRKSL